MRAIAKVSSLVVLGLLGASAALACATADNEGSTGEPPPTPLDAGNEAEASSAVEPDASPDAGPCSSSGLCKVDVPIDGQINVMSISGSGRADVWAVGTNRSVLHYDGTTWVKSAPISSGGTPYTLRSVYVASDKDIWVTDGPMLRHTTGWKGPSATEWTSFGPEGADDGAVPLALGGKDGRVFIARQVPVRVDHPPVRFPPRLLVCRGWGDKGPVDPELGVPGTTLFKVDGLMSVSASRANEVWVINMPLSDRSERSLPFDLNSNRVMRASYGADQTWRDEEFDTRMTRNLFGVWANEDVVWLAGEGGGVRRMTRERMDTRVFEVVPSPVTTTLRAVFGFSADDVWAVGDAATVIHWDGTTWTKLTTPFDSESVKPKLLSIWGSGPKDVWIGGRGTMLHFEGVAR